MKKFVTSFVAVVLLLSILKGSFSNQLMLFLLAGVVPGTNVELSPTVMMVSYIFVTLVIAIYVSYEHYLTSRNVKKIISRKSRLPRRRYSHI